MACEWAHNRMYMKTERWAWISLEFSGEESHSSFASVMKTIIT